MVKVRAGPVRTELHMVFMAHLPFFLCGSPATCQTFPDAGGG